MPVPFLTVTSGVQAQTALANAAAGAGIAQPTGGLSQIDYLSWVVAELLKNSGGGTAQSVANAITAFATGGQTSATALVAPISRVTVCATIGDSVKLPVSSAGASMVVINDGAAGLDVFPATGDVINALAANTAIRVLNGSRVAFYCTVAGTWASLATPLPYSQFSTINVTVGTLAAGNITGAAFTALTSSNATPGTQTTRTATQMFNDTPNARVGDSYMLLISNTGGATFTLGAGSGVTLTGTMTVATGATRLFVVTFTSATALVIQGVSIGTIA